MATVSGSQRQLTHTSNTYESNGDLTVGGNLNINGTTTTVDTANLLVEDHNIVIGNVSSPTDTTADGGGITLKGATDKTINWINSTDAWTFSDKISVPSLYITSNPSFSSEATALVINGSNQVGYRELGSNAFNSTAFLTGNQTITLSGDASGSGTTSINVTVANDSHTHDGRYFTETESDARFLGISAKAADSNLLDGYDSSAFSRIAANETISGNRNFTGTIAVNGTAFTSTNISNWNTAYGWGDHASAGYLTSLGTAILDGDFTSNGLMKRTGAGTYDIVTDNSSNWNTAYGWGNHASAGYLTSLGTAIVDGDFTTNGLMKRTAAGTYTSITDNSSNWNTAYGWGNHASAGYLTGNQTITLSGDVSGSGTTSISVTIADDSHNHVISNIDGLQTALDGKATAGDENIIDGALSIWNADGDGDVFVYSDANPTHNGRAVGAFINIRGDGSNDNALVRSAIFTANHVSTSNGYYVGTLLGSTNSTTTQVINSSGAWVGSAIGDSKISSSSNWNTAYGWGDHGAEGYSVISATETITGSKNFTGSFGIGGASITSTSISNWNTAYGWGDHASQGYATQSYVGTQISNLVDSAPAALDTLNELAAALGDDANFSTTMSTALGNRLRVDTASQGLTSTQQSNGRTNLGLGSAATSASSAFATSAQGTNADTAYGWGNHASAGYLTSLGTAILDGDFTSNGLMKRTAAGTYTSISDNSSNWNTAYGWGNHASAGYLTSLGTAIVDGDFTANGLMKRTAAGTYTSITDNSSNWNTAYGWGNHASQGYLTGNQTITLSGDASGSGTTSINVTVANDSHTHDGRYYTESESDARFLGINAQATNSDKLDGQHGSYYLGAKGQNQNYVASSTSTSNRGNYGAGVWAYSGYSSGSDRPFTYDATLQVMPTSGLGFEISTDWHSSAGQLKIRSLRDCCQGWSDYTTIWTSANFANNSSNWNTAYGWGNHASAGYLTGNQTITLSGDVSGSGTTSISVTVADDSHNHVISNVDGLQTALDGKASSSHTHTFASLTSKPTTLSGYGITDAATSTQGSNADTAYGWGDHSTEGYATQSYVGTQISNLVDSAPAALDTLNELAAALGDDANFSTTMSTALGNRLRVDTASQGLTSTQKSNGRTNLGLGSAATSASSAFATAAQGTNADTAYGWGDHASGGYLTGNQTITLTGDVSGSGTTSISVTVADDSHNHIISNIDGLQTALDAKQAAGTYNTIIGTDSDINTSGSTIIDNIYVTDGVITSMGTRTLTLADLGYTGATNANNYSLPEATSTVRGGIELFSDTDQSVAANAVSSTAGRTYGIQLNSAGQAVVNVPWVDTNTTYNLGSFGITATAAEINKLDGVTATTTELNYTDGVTSNIQTQLNARLADSSNGTISGARNFTGTFSLGGTPITATGAELNYVDGVTSNIQTQLNGKQAAGTYNTIIGTDSDINTSGSTIIDNIYVTDGVITSMGTRTLTASDISALTQSDFEELLWQNTGRVYSPMNQPLRYSSSGTTGELQGVCFTRAEVTSTGNAWAQNCLTRTTTNEISWSGGGTEFGRKLGASFKCAFVASGTQAQSIRFMFGGRANNVQAAGSNPLVYKGFGAEFRSRSGTTIEWRVIAHNGTSFSASSWTDIPSNTAGNYLKELYIYSDGSGNITAGLDDRGGDGSSWTTKTTTGGPTSNGNSTYPYLVNEVRNAASGSSYARSRIYDYKIFSE